MHFRERLPNRRRLTTETIDWDGHQIHVTVGFSTDDRPLEVFARDARRIDGQLDRELDDGAVLISRCLQRGDTIESLAGGIRRLPTGEPVSAIAAVIDGALAIARSR
jgi:hypothetical protein